MKTLDEIKQILQDHKEDLRERYGISRIGIFGSWVKNKQNSRSDLDILAQFEKPISLLTLVAIELQLKKLLKTKVDLVPESDLRPELKQDILEETIYL